MITVRGLALPVVAAPMAGGPSTPALAAAVSAAGGLGFLAAGYKTVDAVQDEIAQTRALLGADQPFGVNVFCPPGAPADPAVVDAYAATLADEAAARGVALGRPRWDGDAFAQKIDLLVHDPVPVVSLTFARPTPRVVKRLHDVGTAVWVTVNTPDEARMAVVYGADALVVQGTEAGGHRGGFSDDDPADHSVLALLQLVRAELDRARFGADVELVAAGGIGTGAGIAAALVAGADAVQLGSALLLCPEAGTHETHREAVISIGEDSTRVTTRTRAFTGRTARAITNGFVQDHGADAPRAYPEVHHLTAPLRAAARESGDLDGLHLWAGQTSALAQDEPAGDLVRRLVREASAAIAAAGARLSRGR